MSILQPKYANGEDIPISQVLDNVLGSYISRDHDTFSKFSRLSNSAEHKEYMKKMFGPSSISYQLDNKMNSNVIYYDKKENYLKGVLNGLSTYKTKSSSRDNVDGVEKQGVSMWENGRKHGDEEVVIVRSKDNFVKIKRGWKEGVKDGLEKITETVNFNRQDDHKYINVYEINWKVGLKHGLEHRYINGEFPGNVSRQLFFSKIWNEGKKNGVEAKISRHLNPDGEASSEVLALSFDIREWRDGHRDKRYYMKFSVFESGNYELNCKKTTQKQGNLYSGTQTQIFIHSEDKISDMEEKDYVNGVFTEKRLYSLGKNGSRYLLSRKVYSSGTFENYNPGNFNEVYYIPRDQKSDSEEAFTGFENVKELMQKLSDGSFSFMKAEDPRDMIPETENLFQVLRFESQGVNYQSLKSKLATVFNEFTDFSDPELSLVNHYKDGYLTQEQDFESNTIENFAKPKITIESRIILKDLNGKDPKLDAGIKFYQEIKSSSTDNLDGQQITNLILNANNKSRSEIPVRVKNYVKGVKEGYDLSYSDQGKILSSDFFVNGAKVGWSYTYTYLQKSASKSDDRKLDWVYSLTERLNKQRIGREHDDLYEISNENTYLVDKFGKKTLVSERDYENNFIKKYYENGRLWSSGIIEDFNENYMGLRYCFDLKGRLVKAVEYGNSGSYKSPSNKISEEYSFNYLKVKDEYTVKTDIKYFDSDGNEFTLKESNKAE